MRKIKLLSVVLIIILLVSLMSGCKDTPEETAVVTTIPPESSRTEIVFDTAVTIEMFDSTDSTILNGAFELCKNYENIFSGYLSESQLFLINSSSGSIEVDAELIDIINKSNSISALSGGKFDITVGKLTDLWSQPGNETVPTSEAVEEAKKTVGYKNIKIQDNTVALSNGAKLDLGGIAYGYIADKLAIYFKQKGVYNVKISIGANVETIGSDNGSPWDIEIGSYIGESKKVVGNAKIKDLAVFTSSIYGKYFEKDGKLYHHIIDPATGYPLENHTVCVTVFAPEAWKADALSTACLLMDYTDGLKLIEGMDGVEAIFVLSDGSVCLTDGVGKTFEFVTQKVAG